MAPNKSLVLDGFNLAFYQHFLPDIGNDISYFVLYCHQSCSFPLDINDAIITLIMNKANPEVVGDLRPIALCNVIYKIIAKIVANKIKMVSGYAINDTQSAFPRKAHYRQHHYCL